MNSGREWVGDSDMNTEACDEAPRTLVTVRNWYDDRRNVAALIRHFGDTDLTVRLAADLVAKPWCWDNEWDAYQATLPEADRWCARGGK